MKEESRIWLFVWEAKEGDSKSKTINSRGVYFKKKELLKDVDDDNDGSLRGEVMPVVMQFKCNEKREEERES